MTSSYRPGKRRASVGKHRISHNRIAWARTVVTQLSIMRYTPEEMREAEKLPGDVPDEYGDTIRLMVSTTSGRPYTLNLTAMTHQEFIAFRDLWTLALRIVEPIILERDRRAAEAYANGDDSIVRVYRQLPQFIIRESAVREYGEGIFDGLEYAITRPPGIDDPRERLPEPSSEVAQSLPKDSESQDDRSEVDES